jgi:RimJ/RimL family protein N-acetyltransferase
VSDRRAAIDLRPARIDDAAVLFAWANDPSTRAASMGRKLIPWQAHVTWLEALLGDSERRLWIAEENGIPVGQVRVDRGSDEVGTVSIGLALEARGRGLGREVLRFGLVAAVAELRIRRARAVVLATNAASRRLFEGAGFVPVSGAQVQTTPAAGTDRPARPATLVLEAELAADATDPETRP